MAKKKKQLEPRTFAVPYRVTCEADVFIEASSADEARQIAEGGAWDDNTFFNRCSISDWEVLGEPKDMGAA